MTVTVLLVSWPVWHASNGWVFLSLVLGALAVPLSCIAFLVRGQREGYDYHAQLHNDLTLSGSPMLGQGEHFRKTEQEA
jgi:hypothetical protein